MRVLLTGAFGNIGVSTLDELLRQGHQVRCFDVPTRRNRQTARHYRKNIEVFWGDLRNQDAITRAVQDQQIAIHLAFIIPTLSITGINCEEKPNLAYQVNVGGTQNLINALQAMHEPAKMIFSSSLHIYGQTQDSPPPRITTDPVHPIEHYSHHKVKCEAMLRASSLEWLIVRFAAVLPLDLKLDPGMFDVPLNNRIEYVHTRDVGLALANAIRCESVWGKTLHIGGGPACQYYYDEIVQKIMDTVGIGMLPERAFGIVPFCTDWLDTTESQGLLHYQRYTLDDYVRELKTLMGFRRILARWFRPFVRASLLRKSPYYHKTNLGAAHGLVG
ncbi:MAG: NAD(P)-dependent oxidoreductase [Anaerolineales bacterium]|nr:MAG: NAD(P)-dependent oxidoreductase [Anaerolineales bacterium]